MGFVCQFGKYFPVLAILISVELAFALPRPEASTQSMLKAGVEIAQQQCNPLIHFDTFEFEGCVDQLSLTRKTQPIVRLGLLYFGFVAAYDSSRMGMYGADNTAWHFLIRFRQLQKQAQISNEALCKAIPGDCVVRFAQIKLMEASEPPLPINRQFPVPVIEHGH